LSSGCSRVFSGIVGPVPVANAEDVNARLAIKSGRRMLMAPLLKGSAAALRNSATTYAGRSDAYN